jgi:hypothetical protein
MFDLEADKAIALLSVEMIACGHGNVMPYGPMPSLSMHSGSKRS